MASPSPHQKKEKQLDMYEKYSWPVAEYACVVLLC